MVESESDIILNASKTEDVSFLVVGDPFGYLNIYLINLEQLHILICI